MLYELLLVLLYNPQLLQSQLSEKKTTIVRHVVLRFWIIYQIEYIAVETVSDHWVGM